MDSSASCGPAARFAGLFSSLLVDLGVGNHLWRVEHAQLHARGKQADERRVDLALLQVALLDGVEIRLVIVVVLDHESLPVDALVVHAAMSLMAEASACVGL